LLQVETDLRREQIQGKPQFAQCSGGVPVLTLHARRQQTSGEMHRQCFVQVETDVDQVGFTVDF
jgi:hypothetical protein